MSRLSLFLAISSLLVTPLFSQGSSVGTATALALNGSVSSSIADPTRDHYWKVTISSNGYLRFEVNSASGVEIDLYLYDTDGTGGIMGDSRWGTYSEVYGFLKPGTYYLLVYRYSGSGAYTLNNSFTSPARAADNEPNDSPSTAQALSVNSTSTGHIGFFGSGTRDTDDYWKITTTQNGWLRVQVRSDSLDQRGTTAVELDTYMYDVDGTTNVFSDSRWGTFSQVAYFLRPGTYFVRVYRYSGAGSYEIKADLFTPPLANDVEGNDTPGTASTATINGTVTGNIGYYSNGSRDTDDYWKFTVPSNGKVVVSVVNDSLDVSGSAIELDLFTYDVNGQTSMGSDTRWGTRSQVTLYLRPGTFYARVYRYSGSGAYSLTITHTPPPRANDVEGNDSPSTATSLTYNVASTGHLGYYANGTSDRDDYWRFVAPSSDSIYVHVTSDPETDFDLYVYGPDGATSIGSDTRLGQVSRVGFRPTAGSTYYALVYRYSGAGSYSILATRSSLVSVEAEQGTSLLPRELTLDQNYPNPFNPSTTIRFGLPETGKIRIAIYSLLGQELTVLVDEVRSAAYYSVVWEGKNSEGMLVPSGVYLVRLQFGDRQIVRKIMLVR